MGQTPYPSAQDRHRITRLVVRKSDPFVANSKQAKSTGDGKSVAAAAAKVGTPDVLSAKFRHAEHKSLVEPSIFLKLARIIRRRHLPSFPPTLVFSPLMGEWGRRSWRAGYALALGSARSLPEIRPQKRTPSSRKNPKQSDVLGLRVASTEGFSPAGFFGVNWPRFRALV